MSLFPLNVNNRNAKTPSMIYMVPILCLDSRHMPQQIQIPNMPTITSMSPMTNMPCFFPYFGMGMQNK